MWRLFCPYFDASGGLCGVIVAFSGYIHLYFSVTQTPMARLPCLVQTLFRIPRKFCELKKKKKKKKKKKATLWALCVLIRIASSSRF